MLFQEPLAIWTAANFRFSCHEATRSSSSSWWPGMLVVAGLLFSLFPKRVLSFCLFEGISFEENSTENWNENSNENWNEHWQNWILINSSKNPKTNSMRLSLPLSYLAEAAGSYSFKDGELGWRAQTALWYAPVVPGRWWKGQLLIGRKSRQICTVY